MIYGLRDAQRLVYHYTKSSTAIDHILRDRSLRFSTYTDTNDPKESKTWKFDFGTNGDRDLGGYDREEFSNWLSDGLKGHTKVVCFSMDTSPLSGDHIKDIFHRGFCKPRMWAQYAERHTGVCLAFDRLALQKLIHEQFSAKHVIIEGPVEYMNRSVIAPLADQAYLINVDHLARLGREQYVRDHLQKHYRRLFFEKMTDWRDEAEYRWIILNSSTGDLLVNFGQALVGIIFGEFIDDAAVEEAMAVTSSWSLEYMGLKWKNCSPWYDFGNLRYLHRR